MWEILVVLGNRHERQVAKSLPWPAAMWEILVVLGNRHERQVAKSLPWPSALHARHAFRRCIQPLGSHTACESGRFSSAQTT